MTTANWKAKAETRAAPDEAAWKIAARTVVAAVAAPATVGSALYLRRVRNRAAYPLTKWLLRRTGVWPLVNHYYEPIFDPSRLDARYEDERSLPGIDFRDSEQLALLAAFEPYARELEALPLKPTTGLEFYYHNSMFEADADYYYCAIRKFKPRRIVEIGSGHSSRIALAALERNADETGTRGELTCIEPYESRWLEKLPVRVIRERVERVDPTVFDRLEGNDILFIDSSHIIRPDGDVTCEYLQILPRLRPGVLVHIHDIFTPWNYPRAWLDQGYLWNEQYLAEAFLSMNDAYAVMGALVYLRTKHSAAFLRATPSVRRDPTLATTSFWIRRT